MITTVTFTVAGPPVPKARARTGKGFAFTPQRTKAYEELVRMHALAARPRGWRLDMRYALDVYVCVDNRRRSDVDNFLKTVADALNVVLWDDDSQVDVMRVRREYDPKAPRIEVMVWVP